MTRDDALEDYQEACCTEELVRRDVRYATKDELEEMADARRSTANTLDVLASFALDEGDL